MTAKLPALVNPSDAYSDEVLKCIKETLKKKGNELGGRYDAAKMYARDNQTYVTTISNEEKAWREKFERRKKNLTHGFFADKAKPYQAVGTVYLEAGDLMLNSITSDLRSKITKVPKHYKDSWRTQQPKRMTALQKKLNINSQPMNQNLEIGEATAGYTAIKKRIDEVKKMRKGVQAEQSISSYLLKKQDTCIVKKDDLQMKAPQKNSWKIVRTIGKIMGAVKQRDSTPRSDLKGIAGTRNILARAFKKPGMKKKRMNNEIPEIEDKEEVLQRWRHEVKQKYLILKLQSINSLLCAILNMKSKVLKMHTPLNNKTVKELLRSEVVMDNYGRPTPWKAQVPAAGDDHSVHTDSPLPGDVSSDGVKPLSAVPNTITRERMSSIAFSGNGPRRPRLAQLASKLANKSMPVAGMKLDTWDDLMNMGEKPCKVMSTKPGTQPQQVNKYSMKLNRRRDTTTIAHNPIPETLPPWMLIAQTEKAILEKKRIDLLGNTLNRTAEDVLNEIRTDFTKLQKKLSRDMDDELKTHTQEQYSLIKNKFKTMSMGPISNLALDKMRSEAKTMLKNMKDSTAKPLKWYDDLKHEIAKETDLRNETINIILNKVSRFQFENDKTIPYAKEKLCLLVMSMPSHQLLKKGMRRAILYLAQNVFGAPPEIFHSWLVARKLDVVNAAVASSW